MLVFKTVQTALPLATKIQLNNLVTAVKEASKLNPLLDRSTLSATPEIKAVANILRNPEVLNALKTHSSLLAEIMLYAEVHIQHPVVALLATVCGYIDSDGTMKIPFADSIRLLFAHVCLHSPTTDTQISGPREREVYSIRPLEERSKQTTSASEYASSSSSVQVPEITSALTAEELFDFFKINQTLPASQASDQDYLDMILWTIENRRIREIATIKNETFVRVQFANNDRIVALINQTKIQDGQHYVRNFIQNSLTGNEAAFFNFIQEIVKKPLPYNMGCLEESLNNPRSIAILRDHIYALQEIAQSSMNTPALKLLTQFATEMLASKSSVITPAYSASSQPSAQAVEQPSSQPVAQPSGLLPEIAVIVNAYSTQTHKDVVYALKADVLSVFNGLSFETIRAFGNMQINKVENVLKFASLTAEQQIIMLSNMQKMVSQQGLKKVGLK